MRAQHAVAAWVLEHADLCQVIHGHEWGGVLVDAATIVYFRRLRQGVRSVVTPHGGHMWSMQWKPQRSFSVEPLRIDHQVRSPHTCCNTSSCSLQVCIKDVPSAPSFTGQGTVVFAAAQNMCIPGFAFPVYSSLYLCSVEEATL